MPRDLKDILMEQSETPRLLPEEEEPLSKPRLQAHVRPLARAPVPQESEEVQPAKSHEEPRDFDPIVLVLCGIVIGAGIVFLTASFTEATEVVPPAPAVRPRL